MIDGFRLATFLKFLEDIRIGCKEAYVLEGLALVMLGRLVPEKAVCLCSFYVKQTFA